MEWSVYPMEWRVYPYAVTGKRSLMMYCTETPTDGVLGVGELVVSIAPVMYLPKRLTGCL